MEIVVPRRRRVSLVLALTSIVLAGCTTWHPVTTSPEEFFQQERPDRVRVTRTDGVQLVLEEPELRAGAVVATASRGAVLSDDIETMEVQRISVLRTVLLALPAPIIMTVVGIRSAKR